MTIETVERSSPVPSTSSKLAIQETVSSEIPVSFSPSSSSSSSSSVAAEIESKRSFFGKEQSLQESRTESEVETEVLFVPISEPLDVKIKVEGTSPIPSIELGDQVPGTSSCSPGDSPASHPGGSFTCTVCQKIFNSPGKLKQHSFSHSGEKPFSCSFCNKSFSSKFKLGRHQLIHTTERQHRCPHCPRSFHRKDHLKNHLQIHDPNKQFKCERTDCGKEYNSYMSYRKHCAVHAAEEGDLECKICSKMFESKTDLMHHLKVHVGTRSVKSPSEKKFQCDRCERRFFTRKDVKRHLVVHTGNRDFTCLLCPQKFGRKDHLVRHIKKSHGVQDPSKSVDPLNAPGPSSAPTSISPDQSRLSSNSGSSGDQILANILMQEPIPGTSGTPVHSSLMAGSSISGPPELSTQSYLSGQFCQEFPLFEENIKEEPDFTATVEGIGASGEDITKILGMYLPTDPINLAEQGLLETESPRVLEDDQPLLRVSALDEQKGLIHSSRIMTSESSFISTDLPPAVMITGTQERNFDQSLLSRGLLSPGTSLDSSLHERPIAISPPISGEQRLSGPTDQEQVVTIAATDSGTVTTVTTTYGSLPGFDQAFP